MKLLKTIFGGGAGKLVESIGGVVDSLSTSKEEKLEAKSKADFEDMRWRLLKGPATLLSHE